MGVSRLLSAKNSKAQGGQSSEGKGLHSSSMSLHLIQTASAVGWFWKLRQKRLNNKSRFWSMDTPSRSVIKRENDARQAF